MTFFPWEFQNHHQSYKRPPLPIVLNSFLEHWLHSSTCKGISSWSANVRKTTWKNTQMKSQCTMCRLGSMEVSGVKSNINSSKNPLKYCHNQNISWLDFTPETWPEIEKMLISNSKSPSLPSRIPLYIYRGIKNSPVYVQGNLLFPCKYTGE